MLRDRPPTARSPPRSSTSTRARADLAADPDFTELELTVDEWDGFHADAETLVHRYFELEDPTTIRADRARAPARRHHRARCSCAASSTGSSSTQTTSSSITDYKTGAVPSERYEIKRLAGVHMYAADGRAGARQAPGAGPAALPLEARGDHHDAVRAVGHRRACARPKRCGTPSALRAHATTSAPGPGPLCNCCALPGLLPRIRRRSRAGRPSSCGPGHRDRAAAAAGRHAR